MTGKNRNKMDGIMTLNFLEKPNKDWFEKIPKSKEFSRHWITTIDIEVVLSDGFKLKIPKGNIFDGASIPKILWWLFKPIDKGVFGDFIHDELWSDKEGQLKHFEYDIFEARKFADNERLIWREYLAPDKKIKNYITHKVIRLIGGFFYSKQIKIPE